MFYQIRDTGCFVHRSFSEGVLDRLKYSMFDKLIIFYYFYRSESSPILIQ